MSDTHINAYFVDVDTAKAKVAEAQSELDAAEARLAAKKLEVGFEEPEVSQEVDEKPADQPAKETSDKPKAVAKSKK